MSRGVVPHAGLRTHLVVFSAALALYWFTLAPTVVWGDSTWLALDSFFGFVRTSTASDHPLFVLVGRAFAGLPGDVARNINLESAVFGALAVALVCRCATRLGASPLPAATGGAALAVSHAFWLHAVIAEVYTANAFFLAATLNLLIDWYLTGRWRWLAAAVAVLAVGLMNHLVLASVVPAAVVFVVATKGRTLLRWESLAVVGVILVAVAAVAIAPPAAVAARLRSLWYGPPGIGEYLGGDFDPSGIAREAVYYGLYLVYQFPSPALVLGFFGIWELRRRPPVAALLLLTVAANALIFIRHTVWPSAGNAKYVFYIADYVVFAICAGMGADAIVRRIAAEPVALRRAVAVAALTVVALLPPAVYALVPRVADRTGIDVVHAPTLPYRDNNQFFLNPNKRGERGARRFGEEALAALQPGAVIFADYTPYAVLRYLQLVERRREDVRIERPRAVGGRVEVTWITDGGRPRPTYVATLTPGNYDFSGLTGDYDLVSAGPVYQVCPSQ
jgi:hypothetical protein